MNLVITPGEGAARFRNPVQKSRRNDISIRLCNDDRAMKLDGSVRYLWYVGYPRIRARCMVHPGCNCADS